MSHSREHAAVLKTVLMHLVRIIVSLLILAAGYGVFKWLGDAELDTRPDEDTDGAMIVHTLAALPYGDGLDIEVDGIVTPTREVQVAAEVGGRIKIKADVFRAGNFVTKGTELVEIDPKDYELEVQRSEQQCAQVAAELQEIEAEKENVQNLQENAKKDLNLYKAELARMEGVDREDAFSQSERDQAQRAIHASENAKQALENQLNSLDKKKAKLKIAAQLAATACTKARYDLERTTITAPCDGVIVQEYVEQDSYVQKGAPLFVIEDTSSVEVRCNLKMEDLYWLWHQEPDATEAGGSLQNAYQIPRMSATVVYRMAGRNDLEYTWVGELTRYDGIGLDERTRTVPCRVVVAAPRQVAVVHRQAENLASERIGPPALVRGMYVTVCVHAKPSDNATLVKIPESAVQPGKWLWRVEHDELSEDDKLSKVESLPLIRYITINDEEVEGVATGYWLTPTAESGICEGDRLVISPLTGLSEGMQFKEDPNVEGQFIEVQVTDGVAPDA